MSDDRESTEFVAKPRKPYQFTVRTFFAVAVWLGLLVAAATTLKDEGADEGALGTAILGLAWIAFAELYRRFRATRALVALGSGPALLLALWGVLLVATGAPSRSRGGELLPPVALFLIYALAWGIILSLAVVIERGVDRGLIGPVRRYGRSRLSGLPRDRLPALWSGRLRSGATLCVIHTVVALVAILISLGSSTAGTYSAILLVIVADLPLVPVYLLIPALNPLVQMPRLALASLALGGALYAAMGWLVAYLAERFERRGRAAAPTDRASCDVPPAPGDRDA